MNYTDPVLSAIFKVILAGGGGALIAFLMLKAFAKGWLDAYFQTKTTKLKADQDVALAELKRAHDEALKEVQAFIDKDLHRARKLYDREFDVLSDAWGLLVKAYDNAENTIYEITPPYDQLTDDERIRQFQRDQLEHWEIDAIQKQTGSDMAKQYRKTMARRRYTQYVEDLRALERCITLNGVFMPDGFKVRFQTLDDMIRDALSEYHHRIEYDRVQDKQAYLQLAMAGKPLMDKLEAMIRERLWSASPQPDAAPIAQ